MQGTRIRSASGHVPPLGCDTGTPALHQAGSLQRLIPTIVRTMTCQSTSAACVATECAQVHSRWLMLWRRRSGEFMTGCMWLTTVASGHPCPGIQSVKAKQFLATIVAGQHITAHSAAMRASMEMLWTLATTTRHQFHHLSATSPH